MEWFNDSLKIYLFHYWMNRCYWMNLLNECFKDKYIFNSPYYFRHLKIKDGHTGIDRWNWNFYFTSIPDLKYPILELELIFDSQP